MDRVKIDIILKKHRDWLSNKEIGQRANLGKADLHEANLGKVDLQKANLRGVDLGGANLCGANLSGALGILPQGDYVKKFFNVDKSGVIVYKSFGEHFKNPEWSIGSRKIIEEICNPCRTTECACGINVATQEWALKNCKHEIWKCRIRWEDLPGVVVPYNTAGKIRCERLYIIGKLKRGKKK